jgi:hypothetical protein
MTQYRRLVHVGRWPRAIYCRWTVFGGTFPIRNMIAKTPKWLSTMPAHGETQVAQTTRVLQRLEEIRRPVQMILTLDEAIRNSLEHNYDIEVASFDPAIQTTRVVEAQSAFDAVFFTDMVKNNIDRPSGSQLTATDLDLFQSSYGVRKTLPTGMTASAAYQLNRTKSTLQFQGVNPEYTSNFVLEMRQPMMRGFGLDYNRSLIMIARNDRRISQNAFERKVRDTLRLVDEYYWRLVEARRDIVITARLLAEYEAIYEYLEARQQFDITPVQLAATLANLQQAEPTSFAAELMCLTPRIASSRP